MGLRFSEEEGTLAWRGRCPEQDGAKRGSRSQSGGLDRTVRSGWGQGEVLGGQAETGGGEDRAERDRAWVLCLNTGVPLARATSGESKDKLMWRVG